jgi:peroxiredoxin
MSSAHPTSAIGPGTPAPEFTLHSTPDQSVSLRDFRGQPVVLAFYPANWAFNLDRNFHFPLLADFEPKGEVARRYGVYRQDDGCAGRPLFVTNAEGVIHWSHVSPVGVNPGAAEILSALEELKKEAK